MTHLGVSSIQRVKPCSMPKKLSISPFNGNMGESSIFFKILNFEIQILKLA